MSGGGAVVTAALSAAIVWLTLECEEGHLLVIFAWLHCDLDDKGSYSDLDNKGSYSAFCYELS